MEAKTSLFIERLLTIISWTGWTKGDWSEFLCKFTPAHWMSQTGWTKEEWTGGIAFFTKTFIAGVLVMAPIYILALYGSAMF